ncbi:hypothetical protein GCM10011581_03040 [Saccharopolyspora subtropica]|uniref:Carrier domain-containing protein n=1 Tax=Saccharopolyspora thermophila TaxID=89367 RepID=A0A917JI83_9PSEU|nr:acyl carrier protein [Saccharopolyspora subtropica]GGI69425.1 hypothetical protein GCM10011581_03040 [Saccharopolyspora subtropica]
MDVRREVHSAVENFLTDVCGVDGATVTDTTRLSDVEVESLELVALVQELQRRFDIALTDERLMGVQTVGELVDLVALRLDEHATTADRVSLGE